MINIIKQVKEVSTVKILENEKIVKRVRKEKEQNLGMREATKSMISEIIIHNLEQYKTKENTKEWDLLDMQIQNIVKEIYELI